MMRLLREKRKRFLNSPSKRADRLEDPQGLRDSRRNAHEDVENTRGILMARCKNCKGIDSFEFIEALDSEKSLYQCANCKRVVSATAEEMNDEYRVI